ncbi:MAG: YceI family protein [Pseudonocardiales bacterium]|nr:YceI family protein [Pseudonocardiales bacterium]
METHSATVTPGTYRLDPDHSTVGFAVMHKVSRFRATFADFDATLDVDEAGAMTLSGQASVESVQVKNVEQGAHLQSPEFFDAERHPRISFRSTSVVVGPGGALTVEGELTLRGHVEPVSASGTLTYVPDDLHDQERVGIDLEAVVDRTSFGLNWNQPLPNGGVAVSNDVTLLVELELPKG